MFQSPEMIFGMTSEETLNHRLAIYSVLGYTLKQIDIMLYPLSPFITEYLYLTCFVSRRSLLLESWPRYDNKLVNTNVEDAFDKSKEVVSLANSARMKAQLKRRWPVKQALICSSDLTFLTVEGISNTLKNQLNVENCTIVEICDKTELQKILSLLENKMPIVLDIKLVRKNIAPQVKANMGKVIERFEKINKLELLESLQSSGGKYVLSYEGAEIEISLSDLELSYGVSPGYVMSERDNTIVFISTTRDKSLTTKGLLRDLARNLQAAAKERGYTPTDILSTASIANLEDEEISGLSSSRDELMYLVRVKSIVLLKETMDKINYKVIDLDGRKLKIYVE